MAYTGDSIDSVAGPINLGATVTQETDDAPGDITNAQAQFVIKDASGNVVGQSTVPVAADGTSSTSIPTLPAGRYQVEAGGGTVEILANYYDAAESDLAASPGPPNPERAVSTTAGTPGEPHPTPVSTWLIALALAFVLAESTILMRRAMSWGVRHV